MTSPFDQRVTGPSGGSAECCSGTPPSSALFKGWVLLRALSAEQVREVLSYDPETGEFRWRVSLSTKSRIGSLAGGVSNQGYSRIRIYGVKYRAHRLAWLHFYGEWPSMLIDHINGVRHDNRIANLRDTRPTINNQNIYSPTSANKTGFRGVHKLLGRPRPYCALIQVCGVTHRLGLFATPEDASAAYMAAKARLHPGAVLERIASQRSGA